MKKHGSGHHFPVCRSRGGERTVLIPKTFHQAWHTLFENLNADEVIYFLGEIMYLMETQNRVSSEEIEKLRKEVKR